MGYDWTVLLLCLPLKLVLKDCNVTFIGSNFRPKFSVRIPSKQNGDGDMTG
jgi:hypothetical protein